MAALMGGCAHPGPRLVCRVTVPAEYRASKSTPPPNGEPESVRYTTAYESFWWSCVVLRASNLDARCNIMCSGTPAASAGCRDGSDAVQVGIDGLLQAYGRSRTQEYLVSLARTDEAREKSGPYFRGTPASPNTP